MEKIELKHLTEEASPSLKGLIGSSGDQSLLDFPHWLLAWSYSSAPLGVKSFWRTGTDTLQKKSPKHRCPPHVSVSHDCKRVSPLSSDPSGSEGFWVPWSLSRTDSGSLDQNWSGMKGRGWRRAESGRTRRQEEEEAGRMKGTEVGRRDRDTVTLAARKMNKFTIRRIVWK